MFKTITRNLLVTLGVIGGVIAGTAAVASASTHPVVSVTVDNGHYTTAAMLHVGEKLTEFGYGSEKVTVTSVTPDGPLYAVTFSKPLVNDTVPHQGSLVIDLKA